MALTNEEKAQLESLQKKAGAGDDEHDSAQKESLEDIIEAVNNVYDLLMMLTNKVQDDCERIKQLEEISYGVFGGMHQRNCVS